MITIRLVVIDGKLVGRTESDRWNLATLFGDHVIYADRNQAGLKAARRKLAKMGMADCFKLEQAKGPYRNHCPEPSRREIEALGLVAA